MITSLLNPLPDWFRHRQSRAGQAQSSACRNTVRPGGLGRWFATVLQGGEDVMFALVLCLAVLWCAARGEAASISLSWEPGAGSVQEGFLIERRSGTEPFVTLARTPALTYADTNVPTVSPLCYRVLAYAGFALSDPSNEVCLIKPGSPINFTLTTVGPSATVAPARVNVGGRRQPRK